MAEQGRQEGKHLGVTSSACHTARRWAHHRPISWPTYIMIYQPCHTAQPMAALNLSKTSQSHPAHRFHGTPCLQTCCIFRLLLCWHLTCIHASAVLHCRSLPRYTSTLINRISCRRGHHCIASRTTPHARHRQTCVSTAQTQGLQQQCPPACPVTVLPASSMILWVI